MLPSPGYGLILDAGSDLSACRIAETSRCEYKPYSRRYIACCGTVYADYASSAELGWATLHGGSGAAYMSRLEDSNLLGQFE